MNGKYEEVYHILSNIKKLSISKYYGLVSKYSDTLVNKVIENMILEDEVNIVKFEEYLADGLYCSGGELDGYNYYIKDLESILVLDKDEIKSLTCEMVVIIKKINEIISLIIDDKFRFKSNGVNRYFTSIIDKVNYCLLNCNDSELCDKLKEKCNEFIEIRDKIMLSNLKFVIYLVKNFYCYCSSNVSFSDLVQSGNLGLMRAIETYNPSKFDVSFTTYASYWIKSRIIETINNMKFLSNDLYSEFVKEIDEEYLYSVLSSLVGDKVLNEEFMNYMSVLKINEFDKLDVITSYIFAVDDSEFMDNFSLINTVLDDGVMIEDNYILKESLKEIKAILYSGSLKKTYFDVLVYRYGFVDGMSHTLQDTGDYLGITKQGVNGREQRGLLKIKKMLNQ